MYSGRKPRYPLEHIGRASIQKYYKCVTTENLLLELLIPIHY